MIPRRCPLCNGSMDYQMPYERTAVCVDCWDVLCGRDAGVTRSRWQREDTQFQQRLASSRRRASRS